jgi:septal ring factor EnvC (AmiA/AmiB activator)
MSGELIQRLVRRAVVLALTVAVLGVGVATVQVAAQWRAESAPIDTAPVSMDSISADAASEVDRTDQLSAQLDGVTAQLSDLGTAVAAANDSIAGDSDHAKALQQQLADAKARLTGLQKQMKSAQHRLDALNAAAARQARINASAAKAAAATSAPTGGYEHEGEHDD